jgi:hypothetical protein
MKKKDIVKAISDVVESLSRLLTALEPATSPEKREKNRLRVARWRQRQRALKGQA